MPDIEAVYTPIVEEPQGENRTVLYITIGVFTGLGLFIGLIYGIGYLFSKKIWL